MQLLAELGVNASFAWAKGEAGTTLDLRCSCVDEPPKSFCSLRSRRMRQAMNGDSLCLPVSCGGMGGSVGSSEDSSDDCPSSASITSYLAAELPKHTDLEYVN